MNLLGIDTSTKYLCLGISRGSRVYSYRLEVERKLSRLLIVTLKRILDAAGLKLEAVDYFACGLGPGSFTGLRTGVAAIKGFSLALQKPVLGISSLDIIARNAGTTERPIAVIVDAKRNLLYCGFFKNLGGCLKRMKPYMLLSQEEFFEKVSAGSIILGDAVGLYREALMHHVRGVTLLDKDAWYPKPHHLVAQALERLKDKKFNNAFDIKPIYLYPKECQIKK
ncbi:MAG: tRNA (adenosine(37)-N6)-threonylcarbamoyltransferase complex dimerization subunit type 1 TsaB [Candidatus Omnitrophota bacterium]